MIANVVALFAVIEFEKQKFMIPTIDDLKVKADLFMEQNKEVNTHFYMRQAVIDYMAEFAHQQLLNKPDVLRLRELVAQKLNWWVEADEDELNYIQRRNRTNMIKELSDLLKSIDALPPVA